MGGDRLPRPYRTRFLGVIADGDHKIKNDILVHVPRLRPGIRSIDFKGLLQYPQGIGVDLWTWIRAGAVGFETTFVEFSNEILAENAASAVAGTKE